MGTRHLIAVVSNGEYKVAQYGGYDGYLTGQGADIAKFICQEMDLKEFRKAVNDCRFITKEETVAMQIRGEFPQQFSIELGANILSMIQARGGLTLTNRLNFVGDSLFCEWAYVLDLDNETLEIYKGFNTVPVNSDERFANAPTDGREYYPVRLLTAIGFDDVSVEFLFNLEKSIAEDND